MDNAFLVKIILSFLVGGAWITVITLVAERLGTKIGGMLGSLPSTILVSFLFIAFTQGIDFVTEASRAIPIGIIIDNLFLFALILLLRGNLIIASAISLMLWFALALGFNYFQIIDWAITIPLYLAITLIILYILEWRMHLPSCPKNYKKYSTLQLLIRACFSGCVVVTAVIVAKIFGPFWAGIFSAFPAAYVSSMIILTLTQSPDFAQATGKVLLITSSTIIVYALTVCYTYPLLGLLWGTVISYVISCFWVWSLRPIIRRMV